MTRSAAFPPPIRVDFSLSCKSPKPVAKVCGINFHFVSFEAGDIREGQDVGIINVRGLLLSCVYLLSHLYCPR